MNLKTFGLREIFPQRRILPKASERKQGSSLTLAGYIASVLIIGGSSLFPDKLFRAE